MNNGLFLGLDEFRSLPNRQKLDCLYENQLKSFDLQKIQKRTYDKIRVHQKIQYFSIGGLLAGLIFTFKFFAGRL